MKKIILIFVLIFSFYSFSFSVKKIENNELINIDKKINVFFEKNNIKKIDEQILLYKNIHLLIEKIIKKSLKNRDILIYIDKKILEQISKKYDNKLDFVLKKYFIFSDLKRYLRNNLTIEEKKELIELSKKMKDKQENMENSMKKLFSLNISILEMEKKTKIEYLKNKDIFDDWRKNILKFIDKGNESIYIAYEDYVFHSHYGRLKAYYRKTELWEDGGEMKEDLKNRGISLNKITPEDNIFYTLEEVKKHKIKEDCFIIIDKKVYNISPFFGHHPGGGRALLDLCGKDSTAPFYWIHKFQSEQVSGILEQLYIGELKKIDFIFNKK